MRVRLKFLCEDRDRHGNVRCYVRMLGKPKMRIRSLPGTPEFMEEYQAALSATTPKTARQCGRSQEGIVSLSLHSLLCERILQSFRW